MGITRVIEGCWGKDPSKRMSIKEVIQILDTIPTPPSCMRRGEKKPMSENNSYKNHLDLHHSQCHSSCGFICLSMDGYLYIFVESLPKHSLTNVLNDIKRSVEHLTDSQQVNE